MSDRLPGISEEVAEAASAWLSRRDRGLTAAEQDAYLDWLYRDPVHGRAVVQLEGVWSSLNQLDQWRPVHSAVPNPDLLLPRRSPWTKAGRVGWLLAAAAAAIAVAVSIALPARPGVVNPQRTAIIHPAAERQVLEDGSVIELNTGAKVDVQFTPGERRVRLLAGEAHFTVAKNPARPFIVSAGQVSVQAMGTAFSMSLGSQELSVLVTEGRVAVSDRTWVERVAPNALVFPDPQGSSVSDPSSVLRPPSSDVYLNAGQQVVISLAETQAARVQVSEVTPAQIERALAWQGMRLEFVDMPLRDVVAEFNRYNHTQLAVEHEETAAILVGGNFRADNVDAFVRLLDLSFGVGSARQGNTIVLRQEQ